MAGEADGARGRGILRALVHPTSLVLAAATVGVTIFSSTLALPVVVLWAVMVSYLARRPGKGQRSIMDVSALPPTIQRGLAEVTDGLDEIGQMIDEAPRDQQVLFAGIAAEADGVRESVAQLATTAGNLHNYLAATAGDDLSTQLARIEADVERATDPEARGELERAATDLRSQIAEREGLMGSLEQYQAMMRGLGASTGRLRSTVARMAAGHGLDTETEHSPVRELDEMKASVSALEEVMQSSIMMQQ